MLGDIKVEQVDRYKEIESLLTVEKRNMNLTELGFHFRVKMDEIANGPEIFPDNRMGMFESERILHNRLEQNGAKISSLLGYYVSSVLSDRVAVVIMWAFTLAVIYHDKKMYRDCNAMVTLKEFDEYFKRKLPTAEEYKRLWEDQKEHKGAFLVNKLDDMALWPKNK